MTDKDKHQAHRQKVMVQEASLLVAPSQSRKLAALRDKARGGATQTTGPVSSATINPGLSDEAIAELQKARRLIDARYAAIMGGFPPLKQNKLFTLRFGTMEALKMLPISAIFKRLEMDTQAIKPRLLAKLNYHGEEVGREKL